MSPGSRLIRARKQNKLSLRAVEEKTEQLGAKVARSVLSNLERDKPSNISLLQMRALCVTLNVSLDWVLLGEKQPAYAIGKQTLSLPPDARQIVFSTIDLLKKLVEDKHK